MPPRAAYKGLTRAFGVQQGVLNKALEKIKKSAGLPPRGNTLVDADGNVYIEHTGEWIGNLIDDA